MIIIYNPLTGSLIEHFIFNGEKIASHNVGEIKQYPEPLAAELLNIFGFLEQLTPQKAQEILAKPKEGIFKCEYCDFSTNVKIGLLGHMRGHKDEVAKAKEPQVDSGIIPIVETIPVSPLPTANRTNAQSNNLSGPDFYGPGLIEERKGKIVHQGG